MNTAPGTDEALLTGCAAGRLLVPCGDQRLRQEAAAAFARLAADAAGAGFDLRVASGYRSFDRQLAIFNGKARGERPVFDDAGRPLALAGLSMEERLAAILRFSALPGASRHHWGTDIDVYDAAAVEGDYRVALSAAEVAPGGVFDPLHRWLDERLGSGAGHGFYRPYDRDRGGVAPERWHLSYLPLARHLAPRITPALLRRCWSQPRAADLCWREALCARLPALLRRYVYNVAPPPT